MSRDTDPIPPATHLSESDHSPLALGRSGCLGAESLCHIVVLGDSYSKWDHKTWADYTVGLLQERIQTAEIYNLALPGATAEDDLAVQLSWLRVLWSRKYTSIDSPLDPERTTYFLFFGVYDCGRTDVDELEPIVETIFDAAHDLYVKAGARNFVFIDVPPVHRSPQAVEAGSSDTIAERVEAWNDLLREQAAEFSDSYKEATTLLFSSHRVLTEVLDDPAAFDLAAEDVDMAGGGIWEDDLHLTEHIHELLAERLLALLLPST